MPDSWTRALQAYHYPVNLNDYHKKADFPDYFNRKISGDRLSTIAFEDYFRVHSSKIQPWFEVVFWKMYSQKNHFQQQTDRIISQIPSCSADQPERLLECAAQFMQSLEEREFEIFNMMLGYNSAVATVASFPAFLDPERFPMVDTRVAKWVNKHCDQFNAANANAPALLPFAFGTTSKSIVLIMRDFPAYIRWISWTRYTAALLSQKTGFHWRARDVEMAVFTAWGDRNTFHPVMKLNPLHP